MDRYAAYRAAMAASFISPMQIRWREGLWPADPNPMPRFHLLRWHRG